MRTSKPASTTDKQIKLTGLDGANPLGFFAALGVVVSLNNQGIQAKLSWSDDVTPRPVLSGIESIDELVAHLEAERVAWTTSELFSVRTETDVKYKGEELRHAVEESVRFDERSQSLFQAMVAEDSYDNNDAAKPTDLHFTAGQQRWLGMAREVLGSCTTDDLKEAVDGPWLYKSNLPSVMWDVTDDRDYALSATNPSKDKKLTVPGAEWLAIIGITLYPVFAGKSRTLTPGCVGSWKFGVFNWPLWSPSLSPPTIQSLLDQPGSDSKQTSPQLWTQRGLWRWHRSAIRRSEQGGYGTFGPPMITWERPTSATERTKIR